MPEVMIAFCPRRVCPRERNNRAANEQNSARCFEFREFLKRTSESFNGSLAHRRKGLIHDIVYRRRFSAGAIVYLAYLRIAKPCCSNFTRLAPPRRQLQCVINSSR